MDSATRNGNEALDGGGVESSGKLLLLGLDSRDDGNGKKLLVHSAVEIEDLKDLGIGFGLGEEGGVALLPEELSSTKEGFYER